jgi:ribosomal-protein-alanine N-acetyltransferase
VSRAPAFIVRGARLSLRYPRLDDAGALYALARDPQVTRYFSWGPYREEDDARAWLATLPGRRAAGIALELAIVDRSDQPVGITLLNDVCLRDRRCVVGTWLGRAHWGTGANGESKALVAGLAFGALGMARLGAYADVRNARSQAALERVGFTREGVLRAFHRHDDEPRDVATYSLLRPEWQRSALAQAEARIHGRPPARFLAAPAEVTSSVTAPQPRRPTAPGTPRDRSRR